LVWQFDTFSLHKALHIASTNQQKPFHTRPDDEGVSTAIKGADLVSFLRMARNPAKIASFAGEIAAFECKKSTRL
jgi:hypothetical protein